MTLRHVALLSCLIAASTSSLVAQSALVDAARQARADRAQTPTHVYTNDDLEALQPNFGEPATQSAEPTKEAMETAHKNGGAAAGSEASAEEKQEVELKKRAAEIDKHYRDRVQAVQQQIDNARREITRLERDRVESANQYRQSVGTNPGNLEFQQQLQTLNDQLQAQRDRITELQSELEDAREAARHAGVRLE